MITEVLTVCTVVSGLAGLALYITGNAMMALNIGYADEVVEVSSQSHDCYVRGERLVKASYSIFYWAFCLLLLTCIIGICVNMEKILA